VKLKSEECHIIMFVSTSNQFLMVLVIEYYQDLKGVDAKTDTSIFRELS